MDAEQQRDFNRRLSQWISSQGFWFQMRYSMSGSGVRGRVMFHLLRMGTRVVMLLVVLAALGWGGLWMRTGSEGFSKSIENRMKRGLHASDASVMGVKYTLGRLDIPRFAAEGRKGSFFEAMRISSLRCDMGLLDGLLVDWDVGGVSINKLDIDLLAGADDEDAASRLAEVVFGQPRGVELNSIEVQNANLRWGYAENNYGEIQGSLMKLLRTKSGWSVTFTGGTFRQNWLRGLEIIELVADCTRDGIVFKKARLAGSRGTVDFAGLEVKGGSQPQIDGQVRIEHVDLKHLLPDSVGGFLEGSVSADLRVFGSTNTSDGVGFEGQVRVGGPDVISMRDRLPVLAALSVMDYSRNYHRVDFNEGEFSIKTTGWGMMLSDIDLKAGELFTMQGFVGSRWPSQQEVDAAMNESGGMQEFLNSRELSAFDDNPVISGLEVKMPKRIQEPRARKDGKSNLLDRLLYKEEVRGFMMELSEQYARLRHFQGNLQITIPGDAFERAGDLQKVYPVDPESGRIPIEVPIMGRLDKLTEEQAEQIYRLGRRL